jgi:copper(I)-binding protein
MRRNRIHARRCGAGFQGVMEMVRRSEIFAAILLAVSAGFAFAHEYKVGMLQIVHPHARATQPGAPVSGGYMVIRNTGNEPDRLIAGSADFAGKVEIHEMKMSGDVMQMREIEGGLEIPAGGEVELKPGGYHVMFMKLGEQLVAGEKRKATLTFEKAGAIEVEFNVEEIKPGQKMDHGHSGDDKSGSNHQMPKDDAEQITMLLKEHFDRADAPLTVEPVAISGEWAVASWSQEGRGGRGLLKRDADGWYIHMCGGEAFKHAKHLAQIGIPHHDAMTIEASLADGEGKLGAEKTALFDSFEGVVEVGKGVEHGHAKAHGHGG